MDTLTSTFRDRYLKERWQRLAEELPGGAVALYGAGQHTGYLLRATSVLDGGPRVDVIIDDNPRRIEIRGIPVRRPDEVDPNDYAGVIVSSDSIEDVLAGRAADWVRRAPDGAAPKVVRLYEGMAPVHRETVPAVLRTLEPYTPRRLGDDLPTPGTDERAGYAPENDEAYLARGRETNHAIRAILADHGTHALTIGTVLDWGCSTGRVLRHWADLAAVPDGRFRGWGCDIDGRAIDWATRHLSPPFRFFSTTLSPSLPIADHTLDLVYGISIFTHIVENVDTWLMELRRVTRPDGHVLVTIHDEHTWDRCAAEPEMFVARHWPGEITGTLDDDFVAAGSGPNSLTFWHTDAVRRRWSAFFEILDIRPQAFESRTQTGVLLRPRG